MTNTPTHFTIRIFLVFFLFIIAINAFIFKGLLHPLIFAAILSGSFYPLYEQILCKTKKKEVAATLATFAILLSLVIPLTYMTIELSKETVNLYHSLGHEFSRNEVHNFFFGDGAGAKVIAFLNEKLSLDLDAVGLKNKALSFAQKLTSTVMKTLNLWVSQTISFLFQFLMMLLACYAFFLEGEALKKYIFKLSPLPDEQEQMILDKFSQMNYVTLVCNGVGGLIQGVLAGIGLWICGIESIFLWTTLMIILAFIPLLGISIVTIPASIYLFVTGQKLLGVGFFLYSTVMALYVENVFKPKFIGKRIQVNSILLLFYIIAGMGAFGMAGIFYGPILCILFLTMVELFTRHYLPWIEETLHK